MLPLNNVRPIWLKFWAIVLAVALWVIIGLVFVMMYLGNPAAALPVVIWRGH